MQRAPPCSALVHMHFAVFQLIVPEEEGQRDRDGEDPETRWEDQRKSKSLMVFFVSTARRCWGHQPCTHRAHLFFW